MGDDLDNQNLDSQNRSANLQIRKVMNMKLENMSTDGCSIDYSVGRGSAGSVCGMVYAGGIVTPSYLWKSTHRVNFGEFVGKRHQSRSNCDQTCIYLSNATGGVHIIYAPVDYSWFS